MHLREGPLPSLLLVTYGKLFNKTLHFPLCKSEGDKLHLVEFSGEFAVTESF